MKIVIDIPEEYIENWKRDRFFESLLGMRIGADLEDLDLCGMLIDAFEEAHEIPVPHGKLIDADALTDNWYYASAALRQDDVRKVVCLDDIDSAPTIIEAEE